jgi:hypothetical protein
MSIPKKRIRECDESGDGKLHRGGGQRDLKGKGRGKRRRGRRIRRRNRRCRLIWIGRSLTNERFLGIFFMT